MKRFLASAWRLLRGLPLALLSPILLALAALALFLGDLLAGSNPARRCRQTRLPTLARQAW